MNQQNNKKLYLIIIRSDIIWLFMKKYISIAVDCEKDESGEKLCTICHKKLNKYSDISICIQCAKCMAYICGKCASYECNTCSSRYCKSCGKKESCSSCTIWSKYVKNKKIGKVSHKGGCNIEKYEDIVCIL